MRIGVGDRIVVEYWRVDHRLDAVSDFFRREGKREREEEREGKRREEKDILFDLFVCWRWIRQHQGRGDHDGCDGQENTSTALAPLAICHPFSVIFSRLVEKGS